VIVNANPEIRNQPYPERDFLLGLREKTPNSTLRLRDEIGILDIEKYRDKDNNVSYCVVKRGDDIMMVLNGYQHINFYRGIKSRKKGRK